MSSQALGPLTLRVELERWPLVAPFRITGYVFDALDIVVVTLEKDGAIGRGEAVGVFTYKNDNAASMMRQIESVRTRIDAGVSRDSLQTMLPIGGARNAIDCALWDLEAKIEGRAAWQIAEIERPHALLTTFTCSVAEPERMAAMARGYTHARAIKVKLTGEPADVERLRAVRDARPDVWLGVDANQGFTRDSLERLMPVLLESRVALIEQPFPIGKEALLDGLKSPIPIAADESVQGLDDIAGLVGRCNIINIKLDKCGGLTEALAMTRAARAMGFETMVGNMLGTSLAMAPAFLVGQHCSVVDLDGPVFLQRDRDIPVRYVDGLIDCPDELWGGGVWNAAHE